MEKFETTDRAFANEEKSETGIIVHVSGEAAEVLHEIAELGECDVIEAMKRTLASGLVIAQTRKEGGKVLTVSKDSWFSLGEMRELVFYD